MTARKKGNLWTADLTVQGERIRQFGFATQEAAEKWEVLAREALRRGQPLPSAPRDVASATGITSISTLVDRVNAVRWASQKSGTMLRTVQVFVRWVGPAIPPSEALTTQEIYDYISHLRDNERSGSTINRHLAAISCLAKTAMKLELIDKLPDMPRQKEGEGRIRWFTDEEEADILTTLRLWGQHEAQDLFIFLVDTGARLGEAQKLLWEDITKGNRIATFWETKAGNSRSVPLTTRAREAIERRRAESGRKAGPFDGIARRNLHSLWDRLRTHHPFIGDAVIHTFRHTCASRMVQKGVDLMRVRVWMGHKAIQTTLRYAHLAPKHLDDVLKVLEQRDTPSA